jgi:hypothetical protein
MRFFSWLRNLTTSTSRNSSVHEQLCLECLEDRLCPSSAAPAYSTLLGGSSSDVGYAVAVDRAGNTYVTGTTSSTNFPTTSGAFQTSFNGGKGGADAFVAKFNPAGGLVYATYLGGSGATVGDGIAVDQYGDAYISGTTDSSNFPVKNAFQSKYGGGTGDAFVAKLNPTGSALQYSSYLGGNGNDNNLISGTPVGGIAVDSAGNAYLTGLTYSSNFPTQNALPTSNGGSGPFFVTRVNTNLVGSASLVYSTLLGGSGAAPQSYSAAIAVDGAGDAYVTGTTTSGFITTPGAFLTAGSGAFVAKLNTNLAGASALNYATYLSSQGTYGYGIAVDGSGNAYITGRDYGGTVPTTPSAFQPNFTYGPNRSHAFVTVFNANGSALIYSTYLGGSNDDVGRAIAVDGAGHIYVAGYTDSSDFPVQNAFQPAWSGASSDAFVAELDPSQTGAASLVYSSYLGGNGSDYAYGIAVDEGGNAYVIGYTSSTNFPTRNAFQAKENGNFDVFVTKIETVG